MFINSYTKGDTENLFTFSFNLSECTEVKIVLTIFFNNYYLINY